MNWFQGQFHLSGAAPRETVCCLSPTDAGGNASLEGSFSWRYTTFPGLAILPAPGRKPPLATKERNATQPQPGGPASTQRRRDRGETQSRTFEHRAQQVRNGLLISAFLSDLCVSALNSSVGGMRASRLLAALPRCVLCVSALVRPDRQLNGYGLVQASASVVRERYRLSPLVSRWLVTTAPVRPAARTAA